MEVSATVSSSRAQHEVAVRTGSSSQSLVVPSIAAGAGSAIVGGEFLILSWATSHCNDLCREAEHLGISIEGAHVEATADQAALGR